MVASSSDCGAFVKVDSQDESRLARRSIRFYGARVTTTQTVTRPDLDDVEVTVNDVGQGLPFVVLHGGAGPVSVAGFADLLARSHEVRVLAPTHPGFGGTPRPTELSQMRDLATLYVHLVEDLDLTDVTVIGNSIGGWIAAEVALLHSPRVGHLILVDAVGLQIDAHPIVDFFSLTMDQVADLSYADPDRFRINVEAMSPEQKAAMAANRATLQTYGGTTMADPGLLDRLAGIDVPTLVVWGAADRVVPAEHGHAYADHIPGARLVILEKAGHLPQLEAPDELLSLVWDFTNSRDVSRPSPSAPPRTKRRQAAR
jgi:pimeloyl-ACP methyl ester carboxylesterase